MSRFENHFQHFVHLIVNIHVSIPMQNLFFQLVFASSKIHAVVIRWLYLQEQKCYLQDNYLHKWSSSLSLARIVWWLFNKSRKTSPKQNTRQVDQVLNTGIHMYRPAQLYILPQRKCSTTSRSTTVQFVVRVDGDQLLPLFFLSATSSICLCLLSKTSILLASLRARSWALSSSTSSKNLCLYGCGGGTLIDESQCYSPLYMYISSDLISTPVMTFEICQHWLCNC